MNYGPALVIRNGQKEIVNVDGSVTPFESTNSAIDPFVNPMPEASPVMPSYDYPSFDSKDYSSNFDKVSNKLDFNSIEGIERARKQEIDDINAKYDSIIKLYKDLETFKNWSNNIWKSFTPPTVGNSYNDDSNSGLNTPKF